MKTIGRWKMAKRFIDLSIAIEAGLPSDPEFMIPEIEYRQHEEGAQSMVDFFPGMDPAKDLPKGLGWAVESLTLTTHSGTHLDAPWHYHPTMSGGKPALTIDEVPLEWCMGPGVVLDFRHYPDGYRVMAADVEKAFEEMDYQLEEGNIVLVMTGADKYWGKREYLVKGCGMSREATLWILDHGVKVTGTDAWSWDRPLPITARDFKETGDSSLIWEGHFASIDKGYCHIEKLTNLDRLPPYDFTFFCFPVKIKGASAGWIRAVALLED
jgi:kynurenine formamidase